MSRFCAIALVIVLGVVAPVTAQDKNPKPDGTWTVKVHFDPGGTWDQKLVYLQSFTSDGRTTLLLPFGPGSNAGDTRVGCMGEWRNRPGPDANEYDFTIRCLYDQTWDNPYGEIRGIMALNKAGDRFAARFTYFDWDKDGVQGWGGEGVMTADRVVLKPVR